MPPFHQQYLDPHTLHVTPTAAERPLSWHRVLDRWAGDPDFVAAFSATLADAPFRAFRWECPPLTREDLARPFEFVLVDAPELERPADPEPFAGPFRDCRPSGVVQFANLGGDARLVAPCPGEAGNFAHLAAFVRTATANLQQRLWATVAATTSERLDRHPLWLSTAGDGVAWLHVRLDDRPKYYSHGPYREYRRQQ